MQEGIYGNTRTKNHRNVEERIQFIAEKFCTLIENIYLCIYFNTQHYDKRSENQVPRPYDRRLDTG